MGGLFVFSDSISKIKKIPWKNIKGKLPFQLKIKKIEYDQETQTDRATDVSLQAAGLLKAVATSDGGVGAAFVIKKIPFAIGRGPGMDYRFKEETVSAHHLDILENEDGVAEIVNASSKYSFFMVTEGGSKHQKTDRYKIRPGVEATVWLTRTVSLKITPLPGYKESLESHLERPLFRAEIKSDGTVTEVEWEADGKGLVIGRGESCDVVIPVFYIEPSHVKITYDPESKTFRMDYIAAAKDSVFSVGERRPMKPGHILSNGEEFLLTNNKKVALKVLEAGQGL
jgi:hypothetical protein